jgi:hypothetical protein
MARLKNIRVVNEQQMSPGTQLPANGVPPTSNMAAANKKINSNIVQKKATNIQNRMSAITNQAQNKISNVNKQTQNQINSLNKQLQNLSKMNEEENVSKSRFFLGKIGLILKFIIEGNFSVVLSKEDKELANLLKKDMYSRDAISKIKEELAKPEPKEEMLKVLKMKIQSRVDQLYKEGKTNVR